MVGTVSPEMAEDLTEVPLFVVPKLSTISRIYAVQKEAFAAGSTVTVAVYMGSESGKILFAALPLDVTGAVVMGDGDTAGKWFTDEYVGATFNQAAVDSIIGEAQIVIEFTEVPVCAGAYSK